MTFLLVANGHWIDMEHVTSVSNYDTEMILYLDSGQAITATGEGRTALLEWLAHNRKGIRTKTEKAQ